MNKDVAALVLAGLITVGMFAVCAAIMVGLLVVLQPAV